MLNLSGTILCLINNVIVNLKKEMKERQEGRNKKGRKK